MTVPNVVGMKQAKASSELESWSFVVVKETVDVEDEAQNNVVISQSPAGGGEQTLGGTVVIQIGNYVDPGDDPGADYL